MNVCELKRVCVEDGFCYFYIYSALLWLGLTVTTVM